MASPISHGLKRTHDGSFEVGQHKLKRAKTSQDLPSQQQGAAAFPQEFLCRIFSYLARPSALKAMHEVCKGWSQFPFTGEHLDLSYYNNLSDGDLNSIIVTLQLKGHNITSINLDGSKKITVIGLSILQRLQLRKLSLKDVGDRDMEFVLGIPILLGYLPVSPLPDKLSLGMKLLIMGILNKMGEPFNTKVFSFYKQITPEPKPLEVDIFKDCVRLKIALSLANLELRHAAFATIAISILDIAQGNDFTVEQIKAINSLRERMTTKQRTQFDDHIFNLTPQPRGRRNYYLYGDVSILRQAMMATMIETFVGRYINANSKIG